MNYGIALVAGKYPTSSAFLTAGCSSANSAFGFLGLKVFWGPDYATDFPNQDFGSTPTNLTELAQTTPMAEILSNSNITTYYLNCWSFANGTSNPWVSGTADLAAEYTEIYNLVVHLRSTYSNKTFYIQCWEGDWSLIGAFDSGKTAPHDRHQRMVSFYKQWRHAIDAAAAATTGTCKIKFGIELNRTLDGNIDRVWSRILPEIGPDEISLSAYEAINTWGSNQTDAENNTDKLLKRLVYKIRQTMPYTPIYIGEAGWPEAEPSFTSISLNAGGLIQRVIDTGTTLGIGAFVYWNYTDNEEISPSNPRGYYLLKPDASHSQAGTKWQALNSKTQYDTFLFPDGTTDLQLVADDLSGATWVDRQGNYNATKVGSISKGVVPLFSSRDELYGAATANYFTLAANAAHEVTTTSQKTWEFIIKAGDGNILGRYGAPYGGAIELSIVGTLIGVIYDDTGGGAYRSVFGATTLTPGNYYHIAFVLDSTGTDTFKCYVNGVEDGSSTGTTGTLTPGAPQTYGIMNSVGNDFAFAGRLIEFMRHTTNLTATQIKERAQLFNFFRGY